MIKLLSSVCRAGRFPASIYSRTLWGGVLALCLTACSPPPPPAVLASGPPSPRASVRTVEADWEDIDAALYTALRVCQIAQESRREYRTVERGEVGVLEFRLLTVRGDSGLLRARRLEGGLVELHCRIGAVGSAEAERCILDALETRLTALHGRDYAPLRE